MAWREHNGMSVGLALPGFAAQEDNKVDQRAPHDFWPGQCGAMDVSMVGSNTRQ